MQPQLQDKAGSQAKRLHGALHKPPASMVS